MTNDKNEFRSLTIDEIQIGMRATHSHTVTDADVKSFAALTGDNNPLHLNDEFAKSSKFGARIVHGMFLASFFPSLMCNQITGPGSVYVSQTLRFKKPVYVGDTVVAEVIVSSVNIAKRRVFFNAACSVNESVVIEGEGEAFIPKPRRTSE
ncbi:MAG: MaoC family dehydratase [Methylococcales bacterium]|nr:MaoC family dehydratase [Methylococcales bacterium]